MIRSSDPPSGGPSELYVKGASSGGGGAATIADGADVVEGSLADAAVITDTTGTINGKLRGLVKWAFERMPASLGQKLMASSFPVVISSDQSPIPVTGGGGGTEYTEDDASVANPVGNQLITRRRDTLASETTTDGDVTALNSTAKGELYIKHVDTIPISAAALPLPTGASTSALQLPDGHNVTVDNASIAVTGPLTDTELRATPVPISGTVTANAGTNLNTSLLALEAGGNLATLAGIVAAARAAVNLIAAQVGITGGAGVVAANTPRNTLASDDPAVVALQIIDDWDETDRAKVNTIAGQVGVQGASGISTALTQRVVLATDVALPTGDNNIGNVDVLTVPADPFGANADAAVTAGATGSISAKLRSISRDIIANIVLATGANLIGDVGIKPRTTGGLTTFHLVSAATTNATNIKASAGQLFGWYIYNSNAAARKVAFHNTAGTPTAGASIFFTIVIPPSSAANVFSDIGIAFATGIGITTVTGLADSDATAIASQDLNINLFYA